MIKKPNLRVIDQAIDKIERGGKVASSNYKRFSKYSCLALADASFNVHTNALFRPDIVYKEQYRMYVKRQNGGKLPNWWNDTSYARHWRITALKGFRKACIDAAKKQARG